MFYNLFDSHTHSENSHDGKHSISFMAETAITKGLQGISITDHCDGDIFDQCSCDVRIMSSALGAAKAKEAFGDRLIITLGLELAETYMSQDKLMDVVNRHNFDFIIGSVHKLSHNNFDFYDGDYATMPAEQLDFYIRKYFEELIARVKWGHLDVVGHFNIFIRYPKLYNGITVDMTPYKEEIDEVLRLVVQNGKGIEINTSGLRSAVNETMPNLWILKRFKELGGEIVTIGSDSHTANDLGAGIEDGMQMLADAGFKYFAFYRKREPVMLRII